MADMLPSIERLAERLRHIPSIGKKTAVRMAFSILDFSDEEAQALIDAITEVKQSVTLCPECFGFSENNELCEVCADPSRDRTVICVVEDYRALMALEKVRDYNGLYHVLHGVLSPLDGIGPERLKIAELAERIKKSEGRIREIILATNPDVEGEATAAYLHRLLSPLGLKICRLAYGMPVGGELEFTDEGTLTRALCGRREMND